MVQKRQRDMMATPSKMYQARVMTGLMMMMMTMMMMKCRSQQQQL